MKGMKHRMKPRKTFLGLLRNCLNCNSLRWSHIHFISLIAVHIISFCAINFVILFLFFVFLFVFCLFVCLFFVFFVKGDRGQCLSNKAYRSAPGGSGAGGSVVIITKTLHGNPNGKISVLGGDPVKCAFGTGGGKLMLLVLYSKYLKYYLFLCAPVTRQ